LFEPADQLLVDLFDGFNANLFILADDGWRCAAAAIWFRTDFGHPIGRKVGISALGDPMSSGKTGSAV
jgi:hypothetical protein